jgi:DNA polymerase-1
MGEEARRRIELLLEYRTLGKLYNTYVIPMLQDWITDDERIHANFSAVTTETGRLSCSEPNLMNIPTRSGAIIERAFVSRWKDEGILLKADFSQHELRVGAIYADDDVMKQYFGSGIDIHTKVAMEVCGLRERDSEERKKELRRLAKGVNFGILYGIGARGLADWLGVSEDDAKKLISEYFSVFKDIRKWLDSVIEFARRYGYVRSMFGRFRWIDTQSDGWVQKAVNTPIQSAASDIAGICAWNVARKMKEEGLESKLVNFVHDSMIVDCKRSEIEKVECIISMEVQRISGWLEGGVKFEVEIEKGKSWGDME